MTCSIIVFPLFIVIYCLLYFMFLLLSHVRRCYSSGLGLGLNDIFLLCENVKLTNFLTLSENAFLMNAFFVFIYSN